MKANTIGMVKNKTMLLIQYKWNAWILLALMCKMVSVESQCLGTSEPAITLSSNVAMAMAVTMSVTLTPAVLRVYPYFKISFQA